MPILALFSGVFSHWSAKAIDIALSVCAALALGWWLLSLHDQARDDARDLAETKAVQAAKDEKQAAIVRGLTDLNTATQAALVRVASIKAAAHALPPSTGCINSPAVDLLRNRMQPAGAAGAGQPAVHP